MVTGLLDTSLIVDILRLYPVAQSWLRTQAQLGAATAVWVEVIQGANNRQKQTQAITILRRFEQIQVISADFEWTLEHLPRFKLSHNIGGMDCLIAAVSYRLQIPLFTTNLKHFTPLLGELAQKPY